MFIFPPQTVVPFIKTIRLTSTSNNSELRLFPGYKSGDKYA